MILNPKEEEIQFLNLKGVLVEAPNSQIMILEDLFYSSSLRLQKQPLLIKLAQAIYRRQLMEGLVQQRELAKVLIKSEFLYLLITKVLLSKMSANL